MARGVMVQADIDLGAVWPDAVVQAIEDDLLGDEYARIVLAYVQDRLRAQRRQLHPGADPALLEPCDIRVTTSGRITR